MTRILIKKFSKSVDLPKYETSGSSGMDLAANIETDINIDPGKTAIVPTGFALSIPKGFEVQIRPRSGLAAKQKISVLNTPGTIDADYRGEIKVILINLGNETFKIEKGLRIAQMVVCPVVQAQLQEVDDLEETKRGKGGFGSTGTKWFKMKITTDQFKRFEKQIILKKIGVAGQKKIFSANAIIVGLGGLGCPLLTYLSSSGVGKIGIVDFDKVEISNLNRQTLFNPEDIGKFKVYQAKKAIKKNNRKIKIIAFNKNLTSKNINKILKDFNIICDGTDNYKTRYLINDYCKKNQKILISSAISKFDGQLMKFNFKKKGPCYRCFMPNSPNFENNCQTEGIFSPVAGIMGSLQANEVLKSILKTKNDLSNHILIFDSLKTEFRKAKISINPKCINKC